MFHRTGQTKTAFQLLYNVVWASSVGGLAVIAEERRRRVAIAQSIIENGKKLQAYKSYQTAAVLEMFDRGDSWDTKLPNVPAFQDNTTTTTTAPDIVLTSQDWQSRGRARRVIPSFSLPSSPTAHRDRFATEAARYLLPAVVPPAAAVPESSAHQEVLVADSAKPILVQSAPFHSHTHKSLDKSRHKDRLQEVVAKRAIECFKSGDVSVHTKGCLELIAYFRQPRHIVSRAMRDAIQLSRSCGQESNDLLFPETQWLRTCQTISQSERLDLEQSSEGTEAHYQQDAGQFASEMPGSSQTTLAITIQQYLHQALMDDAYYKFQDLCKIVQASLSDSAVHAIRNLLSAYKSIGAFSVVRNIQRDLLRIKEWKHDLTDFLWLLEREIPCKILQLCTGTIKMLFAYKQEEHGIKLWMESVRWLFKGGRLAMATKLFIQFLASTHVSLGDINVQKLARNLYPRAVQAGLFEESKVIFSWMTKHEAHPYCSNQFIKQTFLHLLQYGRMNDAMRLYVGILRYHNKSSVIHDGRFVTILFSAAFKERLFEQCNVLLKVLVEKELGINQSLVKYFIETSQHLFADTAGDGVDKLRLQGDVMNCGSGFLGLLRPIVQSLSTLAFRGGLLDCLEDLFRFTEIHRFPDLHCYQLLVRAYSTVGKHGKVLEVSSGHENFSLLSQDIVELTVRAACIERKNTSLSGWLHDRVLLREMSLESLDFICHSSGSTLEQQTVDEMFHIYHTRKAYINILELFRIRDNPDGIHDTSHAIIYHAFAQAGPVTEFDAFLKKLAAIHITGLSPHSNSLVRKITGVSPEALPSSNSLVSKANRILISRCWRSTRNLHLTREIFEKIKTLKPLCGKTVATFDSIILACIEATQLELAQFYVDEMSKTAGLTPSSYTMSLRMLASAKKGDWEDVEGLLESAQAPKFLDASSGAFFKRTFHEFCCQHDSERILEYAGHIVNRHKILINQTMAGCVTKSIIKEERSDLMAQWLVFLEQHSLEAMLDTETLSGIMHRICQTKFFKFQPYGVKTESSLEAQPGEASMQLTNYLRDFAAGDVRMPIHSDIPLKYKINGPPGDVVPRRQIERQMLAALADNQPQEAVLMYMESLVHGIPKQEVDLELAVHASLLANPFSSDEAATLIQDAVTAGMNIDRTKTPFLIHSIRARKLTEDEAHDIAFQYYKTTDQSQIPLHHHVTIAVARNLFSRGMSSAALRVMKAAQESDWFERKPYDLACMTMILRIFLKLGQMDGIRWVVRIVIDSKMRIDLKFVRALQLGRQLPWRRQNRAPRDSSAAKQSEPLNAVLDECIAICKAKRSEQRQNSLKFAREYSKLLDSHNQISTTSGKNVSTRLHDLEPLKAVHSVSDSGSTPLSRSE